LKNHIPTLFLLSALLSSCSSIPALSRPASADTRLIVVLVGGNSETLHDDGIWKLYKGRDKSHDAHLLTSIRKHTGLGRDQIATYYFSWTGDDEDRRSSFLPGHWNWIYGGADYIAGSLKTVLDRATGNVRLAIIGWSNGGATAYELACTLGTKHQPDILVTLDPVSWTTKPCSYYSNTTLASPRNWIDVYTRSGPASRLKSGNIIAFLGRAWNDDHLPSSPTAIHKLSPANHGDIREMWDTWVVEDSEFKKWAVSFKR
jgi:hypothetical protein